MAANKEPNIDSNTIIEMKISELHPFQNHPFKVLDDELMQQTIDSIAQVGGAFSCCCSSRSRRWL